MENTTTHTRRISLEDDFMNYQTDDTVYAYMRYLSTVKENLDDKDVKTKNIEYLTLKNFSKYKSAIALVCECTPRSITNKVNKLIEKNLVKLGEIKVKNYTYPCYFFPYEYTGKYKLVNKDMLKYLIDTRPTHIIRIYLYLLNKYEWKKDYVFTLQELKVALGFAEGNRTIESTLKNVLNSLAREGIIKWETIYETANTSTTGNQFTVAKMKLTFVATNVNQLEKI